MRTREGQRELFLEMRSQLWVIRSGDQMKRRIEGFGWIYRVDLQEVEDRRTERERPKEIKRSLQIRR